MADVTDPDTTATPSPSSYGERVPAVARAVQALEYLAAVQSPVSLSGMSRAIGVGPSSLLAILTTLRANGLVSRSARDGRYSPGPALVALGTAASQCLEPLQTFDRLAEDLVDALGETVVLLIQHGDELVLAAARDGTQPLRYVPPVALRVTVSGWASEFEGGIAAGELEPGVSMLGVTLDERSLLAVVGPTPRLSGDGARTVRAALRAVVGEDELWTGSGPIEGAELDAFLDGPLVASVSYLSDDGYPASVPLWYDWDGTAFWLVPSPGAEWATHVRRNPRVSLAISESTPPLRRVLARGPIAVVDDGVPDRGHCRAVEMRLAARYARLDAAGVLGARAAASRVVMRLQPERLIAWRGLVRPPTASTTRTASAEARRRHTA